MEFNLQNMTLGFNKYTVIWYLKIQRKCYIKKSLDFFLMHENILHWLSNGFFQSAVKKRFSGKKIKTEKQIHTALMATLGLISKLI